MKYSHSLAGVAVEGVAPPNVLRIRVALAGVSNLRPHYHSRLCTALNCPASMLPEGSPARLVRLR